MELAEALRDGARGIAPARRRRTRHFATSAATRVIATAPDGGDANVPGARTGHPGPLHPRAHPA